MNNKLSNNLPNQPKNNLYVKNKYKTNLNLKITIHHQSLVHLNLIPKPPQNPSQNKINPNTL
jgi:hypothetical protein